MNNLPEPKSCRKSKEMHNKAKQRIRSMSNDEENQLTSYSHLLKELGFIVSKIENKDFFVNLITN